MWLQNVTVQHTETRGKLIEMGGTGVAGSEFCDKHIQLLPKQTVGAYVPIFLHVKLISVQSAEHSSY